VQSKVYSTITDINNNGADSADEVLSESWSDGAGRVRRSRSELPNSIGGYSGSLVEYNILGQVKRSSVPTEINSSWNPSGDDYRGLDSNQQPVWLWTSRDYDWKGRPTQLQRLRLCRRTGDDYSRRIIGGRSADTENLCRYFGSNFQDRDFELGRHSLFIFDHDF
jgi:hypothetical protein